MKEAGLAKIRVSAIRDAVAESLRRSLLEGRFRPGEDLSDAAIAAQFQVSRGPVREAMLIMAEEGLLTHTQNRGFSVLNFTVDDLTQIERVRVPLESLALAIARERITPRDLDRLAGLKDELARAFDRGDHHVCVRSEIDFHSAIWELSGNPWLMASLKRIMIPCFTYGTACRMSSPDLSGATLARLHEIYLEYLSGSSDRTAEDCVRSHLSLPPSTP